MIKPRKKATTITTGVKAATKTARKAQIAVVAMPIHRPLIMRKGKTVVHALKTPTGNAATTGHHATIIITLTTIRPRLIIMKKGTTGRRVTTARPAIITGNAHQGRHNRHSNK